MGWSEWVGVNALTNSWFVYMCQCLTGSTWLQGGAVHVEQGGEGTVTNCKFTSNVAFGVSHEGVDVEMTLRCFLPTLEVVPYCILTGSFSLPLSIYSRCRCLPCACSHTRRM